MPRFTILMPYRDAATDLAITLETLLSQTCTDWELLLIDAGSRDGSAAVAAQYARHDRRVRPLQLPHVQQGRFAFAAARNLGLAHARGQVIAFCDPGALWLPEKLDQVEAALRDATVDACFSPVPKQSAAATAMAAAEPGADLTIARLLSPTAGHRLADVALRSEVARTIGSFDTGLPHGDDLEWLIRLVGTGHRVTRLAAAPTLYTRSGGNGGDTSDLVASCTGRLAALVTAARYSKALSPRERATLLRQQARRALRLGATRRETLRLALLGLLTSPAGWFDCRRSGILTLMAAVVYQVTPRALRSTFFAN